MRRLTVPALLLVLNACVGDSGEYHTGPGAVSHLDVLVRPSSAARVGDTLTFFAVFPDSASERYRIRWDSDPGGRAIPSGCTRGVCTKWIVPSDGGRDGIYQHHVRVSGERGVSGAPFTTTVLP